jgi:osmotically-inducible protein OsmY
MGEEMRTDSHIERDVVEELSSDPEAEASAVAVHVMSGIVTLSGTTATYAARIAVRQAACRIFGVRAVIEELRVTPPPRLQRTDVEIARAVRVAHELHVQVPEGIRFGVVDGCVTLEGVVRRQVNRCAAEHAVSVLAGVRAITNHIRLEPRGAETESIVLGIERAMHRSAELDCKHIVVEAAPGGEVSLRGAVRSWAEYHDAERAAWSASGVRGVTNRLAVVL